MGSNHDSRVARDLTRNDWCGYRVKIKYFAIFKRRFSDPVSKNLPSARKKALGKTAFAIIFFTESGLPSAALGKSFAECKKAFAECIRHSAKSASPVVLLVYIWWLLSFEFMGDGSLHIWMMGGNKEQYGHNYL
jgi:hypothetical protein